MAGYIPKERLHAYTRWQADDFAARSRGNTPAGTPPALDPAGGETPDPRPEGDAARPAIPLPTVEELERVHEAARESGYEAGFAEGRQAGYEAGRAEGVQDGNTEARASAEQCRALCQGLQEALASFDQEMAEAVFACALEVARQVVRGAVRAQPETLLPVIREALAALPLQHAPVTLLVSPEDAGLAQGHLGNHFSAVGWRIQADPEIARGGCRLKAGSSEVDATLDTRWRRTLEAIGVVLRDGASIDDDSSVGGVGGVCPEG
ncbi:MAG: flagellar assembly protein FliH [Zoogloeaceae bacterium]|jgi:flagellar assembly protein FliH|nr:flagellar assembly protein FliH [Zoogloeaceae bacterium]